MPAKFDASNMTFAKAKKKPSVAKKSSKDSKDSEGMKIKKARSRADLQKVNKPKTRQGMSELFSTGGSAKPKRK